MSLKSFSVFNYGQNITSSNKYVDFAEGGPEKTAIIQIGSYSLEQFLEKLSDAMNLAGGQEYSVTINRVTRRTTISAASNFSLLVTSGSHFSTSAWALIGFTSDKSGSNSYMSDLPSGFIYEPQFKLQRYIDFNDYVETIESSVNTSASGIVEVVSFGQNNFMECNIMYATDILGQGAIKNNGNGVSDLRDFMNYLIKKRPVEFVPDIDNPSVFIPCILEKTRSSSSGVGFQLYEMYGRGLANYYETQTLTFRKV